MTCKNLKEYDLSRNHFDDQFPAQAADAMLRCGSTIARLNLDDNQLTDANLDELIAVIASRWQTFDHLSLRDNLISAATVAQMTAELTSEDPLGGSAMIDFGAQKSLTCHWTSAPPRQCNAAAGGPFRFLGIGYRSGNAEPEETTWLPKRITAMFEPSREHDHAANFTEESRSPAIRRVRWCSQYAGATCATGHWPHRSCGWSRQTRCEVGHG
ncbi:MAG: hypothetical protein ACRYGK_13525 [Janthinobacterium lividum]